VSDEPGRRPRFPLALDRLGPVPGVRLAPAGRAVADRPPGALQQVAVDAARRAVVPTGLGLDSASVRSRMVQRLRAQGVADDTVLQAFAAVLRHRFVDSALATQAYEDTSLPIGLGQTISKPSVVARMLELLAQRPARRDGMPMGRVLEIGTGCGYQAALLAHLARQVVSVERLKPLHDKARAHLADLPERARIRLVWGDGRVGHGPSAPYDGIVAAAGGGDVPEAWLAQLADGGRLVAPVEEPGSGGQYLLVVDRQGDRYLRQRCEGVLFVPLKSGTE
jgi:protein-L-isoaspartate(D-aspartate) O-methyltransferase